MAGRVEIFNLALSRVGVTKEVMDPSELSQEAKKCRLFYERKFKLSLCQYPWPFATRRRELALLETFTSGPWFYRYAMPADCEKPQSIQPPTPNPTDDELVPWEIEAHPETGERTLLTNEVNAILVYTSNEIPEAFFPEHFVEVLAWNLAVELAMPLTKKADVLTAAVNGARTALLYARTSQLNENQNQPEPESEFLRARR